METVKSHRVQRGNDFFPILVIVASATLLRLWLIWDSGLRIGLNIDELQSAAHAYQAMPELLRSVLEIDPHPPLYYLQLSAWMRLGTSDLWLMLNTLLMSVLAVISLYITGRLIFDSRTAMISALFLAISPFAIGFSIEVRMYTMFLLVGIWQWYFAHRFTDFDRPFYTGTGLLLTTIVAMYTYGAAFLLLFGSFVYGTVMVFAKQGRGRPLRVWMLLQALFLVLYIPWLAHASSIELGHLIRSGLFDVAYTSTQMLWGIKSVLLPAGNTLYALSLLVFTVTCLFIFLLRTGRLLLLAYVLLPMVVAAVVSYLAKPIWVSRTFSFVLPFFYLAFALTIDKWLGQESRKVAARVILLLGVVVTCLATIYQGFGFLPWSNLKESVAFVQGEMKEGDIIYVPNDRVYWGWNWYFAGPGHVVPKHESDEIDVNGVLVVGASAIEDHLSEAGRLWVVYRQSDSTEVIDNYVGEMKREVVATFRNVVVEKIEMPLR